MNLLKLPETASTNTWLKENCATLPHGSVALTDNQTAGRGQRGNSWEAEPGKNLTCSILLRPVALHPSRQFLISEIVSLAVVETLRELLSPHISPDRIKVKWPNDIYVDNLKIAGILIEHSISSAEIIHTIAGIGLNVNQTRFLSPAPNPVSMANLASRPFPIPDILRSVAGPIISRLSNPIDDAAANQIHSAYLSALWRGDGRQHPFQTPDGSSFLAAIHTVSPSGLLTLRHSDGSLSTYAFKEISFTL